MQSKKENVISNVIAVMAVHLNTEHLQTLDNSIRKELYNYDVVPMETGIVEYNDTNDRMLRIYAANKKLENLSQKTIIQYVDYNRRLLNDVGKPYNQVTTEDIKFWLAEYSTKVCANTSANARRYLHNFFSWLHDNGYISRNITKPIRAIKQDPPKKEHFTDEEVEMLRDNCITPRELALVDLLLSTGLRVGELMELKITQCDFLRGQITLRSEKSRRFRTVFLNAKAKKHLIEYLNTRKDTCPYVFVTTRIYTGAPKPLGKSAIEDILHKIANRAGVTKKCTVHTFRRTFATTLHVRGVRLEYIKELLGHASTRTTEEHYVSIANADVEISFRKAMAA